MLKQLPARVFFNHWANPAVEGTASKLASLPSTLGPAEIEVTPSEAAMTHLASIGVAEPDLVVGKVQEFSWGWTVHVNTAEFWETKDPMKMLIGLSPVFVSRQFNCRLFPTGLGFEQMCEQFAVECGATK